MPEPKLTPAQQALSESLDKLRSTADVTPELRQEVYLAIDLAVEEKRRVEDSITDAAKAVNSSTRNQ